MPQMYGWLVKEQKGWRLSMYVNSVEPRLNVLSYILPGPGQACFALPAKGREALTSRHNLDNLFHGKT